MDRCAAIFEGLPLAVIATDRRGSIVRLNPAASQLLGASASEVIGQPLRRVVALVDPTCRRPTAMPSCRAFLKDPSVRYLGRRLLRMSSGGGELPVDVTLAPLRDPDGRVVGCLLTLGDLRQTLVHERGLMDRQRVEAIRAMAGTMARDFTNWLSVISGHATAILEATPPETRPHQAAVQILQATHKAGGLMKHLLTVTHPAKPGESGGPEPVPIEPLLEETINLARATFLGERVTLKLSCSQDLPRVWANGIQLLTCLMNLLRRAREAMPQGGTITMRADVHSVGGKTFVVVSVRDTGPALTPEARRQIEASSFLPPGEGEATLGLMVVRTLVEGWGGFLRVSSRSGQGNVFRLFLPTAASPEEKPAPARAEILVVDDDEKILEEVRTALERARFRVHAATNGRDSIPLHRRHARRIGLVLLDALIPGEDVRETFDALLANDPDVSIVMMSGFSRDYLRSEIPRGTWGYLQKPFDAEQLLAAVHRTLQRRGQTSSEAPPSH